MRTNLMVIAAALALAGCVAANSQMLDSRTAMISARGSGYSSTADVARKLLQEAATIAQARGYPYFQIVGAQDATQTGMYVNPGSTNSSVVGSMTCGAYTCAGSAVGSSYSTPGYAMPIVRPGADVLVKFWQASELNPDMKGVYSAADVLAQAR